MGLLTLSELSMLPREKLKQNLTLMPFMHLMDTVGLDTTGSDMDLDTEDLGTLVLDTPDLMALDMDILTTAKLFNRSSTANLSIIFPHCEQTFIKTLKIK